MSRLWDEVVEAYGRPGVKAACLALQNDHGHCVSYLLWAGWAAREGRFADDGPLAACAALSRAWEDELLRPARAAAALDPETKAALAGQSLEAERRLLSALEARTPRQGRPLTVGRALEAAIAAWGGAGPPELVARLAAAFSPS